jgi:hypothetical protein
VNGQQHVLHHIVDAIGGHALPPRRLLDQRHAIAQQRGVGGGVARLCGRHQGRAASVVGPCLLRLTGGHAAPEFDDRARYGAAD